MIKKLVIISLVAAVAWYIYQTHKKSLLYTKYLKSIGIPDDIIKKMKSEEIKASAVYLKRYSKTNQHFQVGDKDYEILSNVRIKYGIFS